MATSEISMSTFEISLLAEPNVDIGTGYTKSINLLPYQYIVFDTYLFGVVIVKRGTSNTAFCSEVPYLLQRTFTASDVGVSISNGTQYTTYNAWTTATNSSYGKIYRIYGITLRTNV